MQNILWIVSEETWYIFSAFAAGVGRAAEPTPIVFQNWNSKINSLRVLNTKCFIL